MKAMSVTAPEPVDPLFPLVEFYPRGRGPLVEIIEPSQMPQPARGLLVHNSDMTSTLERFHHDGVELRVLKCWWNDLSLMREVVLTLSKSGRPVEFGAIRIDLTAIDPEPRDVILANTRPFGAILKEYFIDHESHPSAFIRVSPDAVITDALRLSGPGDLYGRCNTLRNPKGRILAEVVEILPPFTNLIHGDGEQ